MIDSELDALVGMMRAGELDFAADPAATRKIFGDLTAIFPVADDLVFAKHDLGAGNALKITSPGVARDAALLYFHGGAYVVGDAASFKGHIGELGRAAGVTAYSADYRLAPEHRFPAAVDDGVGAYRALLAQGLAPSRIVVAGDSAGGGLAMASLLAARDAGLPMPGAVFLISPWVDLACAGASMKTKAAEDPSLTEHGLRVTAAHYLHGASATLPLASPIHADLTGLPPLLIHVGSTEILLDDAVRLAAAAGAAGVSVRLEIWPRMIHDWHVFGFMLGAGRRAVAQAGAFLADHLAPVAPGAEG